MEDRLKIIKAKIEENHGNVKKFCEENGLHQGTMSKFLNGKSNIMSSTLFSILDTLDINFD